MKMLIGLRLRRKYGKVAFFLLSNLYVEMIMPMLKLEE